jgi:outer membrane protein TolC
MFAEKIVTCVVVLVGGTACFASETVAETDTPQTLPEYLRHAALHNAGLKAAFEAWKAALEEIPQAKALPDPRFTYGYYIEEVETRVGPQRQRVGISQVFPWFGTIKARSDAATARAEAAQRRYDARKLHLFREVKDGFYEYAYLARAIDIARESLELVKHFEEVARTKYITAEAGHPDVIRAQMEWAVVEDKLAALEQLRQPIVARLNAVLNRPTGSPLPWPTREAFQEVAVDRAQVLTLLRKQNPQLQAIDLDIESARHRVALAKQRSYPNLGVGLDWIDTGAATGVPDSGKDPVILMFSTELPIWRKSYGAAALQARAETRRLSHQKKELENDLLARTERILYEFEDSGRKVRLFGGVLVPKARELVGASEAAYTAGTVDFLSLIDAERTLLRFRLEQERAEANRRQRLAELEMLIGAPLPTGNTEISYYCRVGK